MQHPTIYRVHFDEHRPACAGFGITGEGVETLSLLKSCFLIEFEIQQPHGKFTKCRIQHPKDFLSKFGKSSRQQEPKAMSVYLLKMLLVCIWKSFSNNGDRIILPVLLKYVTQKGNDGSDLKETRLQECLEWFETKETRMGKLAASVIVYSGSSPIFVMLSIYYNESMEVAKQKLTA